MLEDNKDYKVNLGSFFADKGSKDTMFLQLDNPSPQTNLNEYDELELADDAATISSLKNNKKLSGKRKKAQEFEFLLIFDEETQEFTLEKLESTLDLRPVKEKTEVKASVKNIVPPTTKKIEESDELENLSDIIDNLMSSDDENKEKDNKKVETSKKSAETKASPVPKENKEADLNKSDPLDFDDLEKELDFYANQDDTEENKNETELEDFDFDQTDNAETQPPVKKDAANSVHVSQETNSKQKKSPKVSENISLPVKTPETQRDFEDLDFEDFELRSNKKFKTNNEITSDEDDDDILAKIKANLGSSDDEEDSNLMKEIELELSE